LVGGMSPRWRIWRACSMVVPSKK